MSDNLEEKLKKKTEEYEKKLSYDGSEGSSEHDLIKDDLTDQSSLSLKGTIISILSLIPLFVISIIIHNTYTYDFMGGIFNKWNIRGNKLVAIHSALLVFIIYLLFYFFGS